MMDLIAATQIVRNKLPGRLIWSANEYNDYYSFAVALDSQYLPMDLCLSAYRVDKADGKFGEIPLREIMTGKVENPIRTVYIDITEEQANAIDF